MFGAAAGVTVATITVAVTAVAVTSVATVTVAVTAVTVTIGMVLTQCDIGEYQLYLLRVIHYVTHLLQSLAAEGFIGLHTTDNEQAHIALLNNRIGIRNQTGALPYMRFEALIQKLLDQARFRLDYIHGEDAVRSIVHGENAVGILVSGIDKHMLFPAVRKNGPLPRKCFSMGEAHEKRYYMEARRIL